MIPITSTIVLADSEIEERFVRASGPGTPVGASGLRGRLRSPRGDVRCIAWQPEAGLDGLFAAGRPFDLQYRLSDDGRGYGLQVEIVSARPGGAGA